MNDNYPPGVTGNEYEIAGPDSEWEEELYCEKCEVVTLFSCESFQKQRSGICNECDNDADLGDGTDDNDWEDIAEQRADVEQFWGEQGW